MYKNNVIFENDSFVLHNRDFISPYNSVYGHLKFKNGHEYFYEFKHMDYYLEHMYCGMKEDDFCKTFYCCKYYEYWRNMITFIICELEEGALINPPNKNLIFHNVYFGDCMWCVNGKWDLVKAI